MLAKARSKLTTIDIEVELLEGSAQTSLVPDASFDAAILNLILSMVPDGKACLQATLRALKPGSRVVVFDKFPPPGGKPSPFRHLMNFFSTLLGTDITRRFEDILIGCNCIIEHREPSILFEMYTNLLIRKNKPD